MYRLLCLLFSLLFLLLLLNAGVKSEQDLVINSNSQREVGDGVGAGGESVTIAPSVNTINLDHYKESAAVYIDISGGQSFLRDNEFNQTELKNDFIEIGRSDLLKQAKKNEVSNENESKPTLAYTLNTFEPVQIVYSDDTKSSMMTNLIQPSKFCVDLNWLKQLFNEKLEPIYLPVVSLLPNSYQVILLDEPYFAGFNVLTSLSIATLFFISFLLVCFISKREYRLKQAKSQGINEKLVCLENELRRIRGERDTFADEIFDLETRLLETESLKLNSDEKVKETVEKLRLVTESVKNFERSEVEMNKNAVVLKNEMNGLKEKLKMEGLEMERVRYEYDGKLEGLNRELNEARSNLEQYYAYTTNLNAEFQVARENEARLREILVEKERQIEMANSEENSALKVRVAELQKRSEELEADLVEREKRRAEKEGSSVDLVKEKLVVEGKLRAAEKTMKEQEIQIKLLNELREKDTIQHLKGLSELDAQLKKKCLDADKLAHFLEQLRVKQERIQELEAQVSRVERQSNQERQNFEKQVHENWINSKKIEKELKEAKAEIFNLNERVQELDSANKSLNESRLALNKSALFSPQTKSLDKSRIESESESDNLQVDTSLISDARPPSTPAMLQPMMPPFAFIRPAYRYPFPIPPVQYIQPHTNNQRTTSSSPEVNSTEQLRVQTTNPNFPSFHPMYQMHPMMMQKQYQQYLNTQSGGNSSAQPSPGGLSHTANPVE